MSSSASLNTSFYFPSHPIPNIVGNLQKCWSSTVGVLSITLLTVFAVLILLPLCIFILCSGVKRWRRRCTGTAPSHTDVFTYHMVIVELFNIGGSVLCCLGVYTNIAELKIVGIYFFSVFFTGQMLFHALTCGERYMAVIHPVTYLSMRTTKGIRIRNVIIACIWLLCFLGMGCLSISDHKIMTAISFAFVSPVLVFIVFCSISVLCALNRSGPGEKSTKRKQTDQSKMRAFITITAILGVLLMRYMSNICLNTLFGLLQGKDDDKCGVWLSEFWFNLPTCLVLPLLFLHRAGKLPCCKTNNGHSSN